MGIRLLPVRLSDSINLTRKTARTTAESSTTSRSSDLNTGGDIVRMPKRVPHGRKPRYTVSDLPLPRGGGHVQIWRRAFLPSLLTWAGAQEDPFGVNGELYDVVTDIWLHTFPGITLKENDVTNLVKVVSGRPNSEDLF